MSNTEKMTYEKLKRRELSDYMANNRGTTRHGTLDKSGRFYHVITHSWLNETIYINDVAQYRNKLLSRVCAAKGVVILFSTIMPNHTHDVFMADNWDLISSVMKSVNTNVSKFIRKHHAYLLKKNQRVFESNVLYVVIKDISSLLYVGKYIYDNPIYLGDCSKVRPLTSFWCFERDHFPAGYDKAIYRKLFGMDAKELTEFYANNNKMDISKFAANLASSWTQEETDTVFISDCSVLT